MRLLRSFAFRFALIQAALFTLAVSVVLALFYWISVSRPTEQVKASILAEGAQLSALYRAQGPRALIDALGQRAGAKVRRQGYHVLIAANGRALTSNLPGWPRHHVTRWMQLNADLYRDGREDIHEALSRDIELPDGARLVLGRDVEDLDRIDDAIQQTLLTFLPGMLLLVIGGAAVTSRAIGKRIDAMSATALRVMEGNLSERVPIRPGNDDFGRLSGTLNAMLDRIEASLESVRRVSDSVAHELRTPLARLQAELAELRNAPPERTADLAERAQGEAERLARMADAVLRISRIEAKRHQWEMRRIDLGELIADAVEYHAPLAEARGQILTVETAPGLEVPGDPDLLFQAVSNLVDNAVKFTPEGGSIKVRAIPDREGALLTIADNGPGIAPELIGKVGERFFRAPATGHIPGFGLGLALVIAVAALHDSILTFSDAKPGLQVTWRLPGKREAGPS